jgi:hypothetical protein
VIAAVLFGLDAIANVFDLFRGDNALRNPVDLASTAIFVLAAAATAALLLPHRTGDFAAGAAIAQALTESARFLFSVRPSAFDASPWAAKVSNTGSYILTALAGIVVIVAMVRERRVAREGTGRPVATLALGFPAAVFVFLGLVLADYTWTYVGDPTPSPCCAWSPSDGFTKTVYVLTAVALIACLLLAVLVTRPGFALGVLVGLAVFQAAETLVTLLLAVSPDASVYGWSGMTSSAEGITGHPESGLWFDIVGFVLLLACCFVEGAGSRRADAAVGQVGQGGQAGPFTAPPYPGVPGYPQPQQSYPHPSSQPYPQPGQPWPGDTPPFQPPQ